MVSFETDFFFVKVKCPLNLNSKSARHILPQINNSDKAEFAGEGSFFANRFPSLRTFVNRKVGLCKN